MLSLHPKLAPSLLTEYRTRRGAAEVSGALRRVLRHSCRRASGKRLPHALRGEEFRHGLFGRT